MEKRPRPAISICSPVSNSSNSSGGSIGSVNNHSTKMAVATSAQKMDSELRCFACRRYFCCPVLLPCGHSLCTSCAAGALRLASDSLVASAIHTTLSLSETEPCSPNSGNSCSSASSTTGSSITGSSQPVGSNVTNNKSNYYNSSAASRPTDFQDLDRVSVVSENDSGVVVISRPNSYIGRLPVLIDQSNCASNSLSTVGSNTITYGLFCPSCNSVVALLDDKGIGHLPRNSALERVIAKFINPSSLQPTTALPDNADINVTLIHGGTDPLSRPGGPLCQLCEDPDTSNLPETICEVAATWCEQCQIFYCAACREKCHPSRGPLLRHSLHPAEKGVEILREKRRNQSSTCHAHPNMLVSVYCLTCQIPICQECLNVDENQAQQCHDKHELQSITAICKARKTELSHALQSLSEKARTGSEYIQRLRSKTELINLKVLDSERLIRSQIIELIKALESKLAEFTSRLAELRDAKLADLKEQTSTVATMLTRSTGLIQFCIEMLKENDPSSFLLVSHSLIARAQETEQHFAQKLDNASSFVDSVDVLLNAFTSGIEKYTAKSNQLNATYNEVHEAHTCQELALEESAMDMARKAIAGLSLQVEHNVLSKLSEVSPISVPRGVISAPSAPQFIVEECISERNVMTLVWQPGCSSPVDRYILELDDGANGSFKKVYRGPETICTVEGLHFKSLYRARVKGQNEAGEGPYSERLCMQTSELTCFHLDSETAPDGILLTNGNRTVTSSLIEDRVVLGSTGLSRGVHYWEFTVDRCDFGGQPAFGIALRDTNKETMLGVDMKSWSVYFDHKRSWFLHNSEHFERTDGGVRAGSVIGIRLDCNKGNLSYYLNEEPHGPIAFTHLPRGFYYPAVSLSRTIQLTLHCGLEAPSESEYSDEDCSNGGPAAEKNNLANILCHSKCTTLASETHIEGQH